MKHLHELTPEQKTRLLAELEFGEPADKHFDGREHWHGGSRGIVYLDELNYDSYDAIIPLVQKLNLVEDCIINQFHQYTTPSQLCDAVLVATRKCEL